MKFFGPFPVDRTVSDVIKGITPNTLYIFSLRCRSEKAVDTERMWSEPNVINYTTLSSGEKEI